MGAVNCMVENAYECMRNTKEIYGKTDKRQAYHLIISFEEGETNPDTAFEIIKEFVNRYLADNYEAVYSVLVTPITFTVTSSEQREVHGWLQIQI